MPKMITKILIISLAFLPLVSFAREPAEITDWYIKDFQSEIQANKDSSLLITEWITADCGNLPNKHGIFRVLPTQIKTTKGTIKNPIELVSITDFQGNPLTYSTIKDRANHTITWKIGDPDVTVTGENYYKIVYIVKNAVRFKNPDFDELYWNLNGNFWEIETDRFSAKIIFPEEATRKNSKVEYYTGFLNEQRKDLAAYYWLSDNALQFDSIQMLQAGQGITVSIAFPKNIFTPYKPAFGEKYGDYFGFIIPIIIFVFSFLFWWKYGKEYNLGRTIVPEFEVPENLSPIQMGALMFIGRLRNNFISASIINMAVKKMLFIEQEERKMPFNLKVNDFKFKKLAAGDQIKSLANPDALLFNKIFSGKKDIVYLSSLRRSFSQDVALIPRAAKDDLQERGLIIKKSLQLKWIFILAPLVLLWFSVLFFDFSSGMVEVLTIVSLAIMFIFGLAMPKRTLKGAELMWRVNGFKLYMKTAEKYRQRFNEKENIFEKFFPYAMVFGITKLWIKKMEQIYGSGYFQNYSPAWFSGNIGSFNADSFTSAVNSISSGISSNIGGASGAGGGGGSGGGGGGGGGGGW